MRTNRLILAALLSTLHLAPSCTQTPEITGEVQGDLGAKIYLSTAQEGEKILDSATIEEGAFSFQMAGRSEGLYELKSEMGRSFLLYYAGDGIKVSCSSVLGKPSRVEQAPYAEILNAHYQLTDELLIALDKAQRGVTAQEKTQNPEVGAEIQRIVNTRYKTALQAHRKGLIELANRNPNCPLSLYFYRTLLRGITAEELSTIDSVLSTWTGQFDADSNMIALRSYIAAEQAVAVGKLFVDITVQDAEGSAVKLSSVAGVGHPVLLYFWNPGSTFCRMANKKLLKLYREYHEQGFEVFAISLDSDRTAWLGASKEDQLPWAQYTIAPNAENPVEVYRVASLPYSILLTPNGRIMVRGLSAVQLEMLLHNMLPAQ